MLTIMIAIDGSQTALDALASTINLIGELKETPKLHLVNVQHPVHGEVASFVKAEQLKQFHQDEGNKALQQARAELDSAGVAYESHIFVGEPAEVIARFAEEQDCDEIIMGALGVSGVRGLLLGSTAAKVMHLTELPVRLIK